MIEVLLLSLSPTAWLVASQFLLYAVGWVLCGTLLREQRAAVFHWAGFMALFGAGFVLVAQRTDPPTWWSTCGGSLVFVSGYVLLRRGMQLFLDTVPRDRENLLILGVVATGFAVLGASAEHAAARVVLAHGASALVLLRLVFDAVPALQAEHGRRVAWLLAAAPVLRGLGFAVYAVRQLLVPESSLELQRAMLGHGGVVFSFIAAAALFNFGFMALVTLRLVRRLQDQSLRDALTGVFNRRALDQDLKREWQRWRRGGAPFAVLSLDLDHFKRINDTHGHLAGDCVLAQAAQRLVTQARALDTVARTGGEEFMVLIPQTDAAGAHVAAQRLRAAIGDVPFDLGGTPRSVTASIGLVVVDVQDADLTQLLQRADRALYQAKAGGRDRVVGEPPGCDG